MPHIPAEPVGSATVHDLLHSDDDDDAVREAARERLNTLWDAARTVMVPTDEWWGHEPSMLRWDCCSPSAVKWLMSKPDGWKQLRGRRDDNGCYNAWETYAGELFDDPRLFDILFKEVAPACGMDWPLTLYKRPLFHAELDQGYPLEFRVFVENHAVIGVSSYYPQRHLSGWDWLAHVVAGATLQLVDACPAFTADYLCVAEPTEDLPCGWALIECGPPHIVNPNPFQASAHPCCFPPGRVRGIALSRMEGALNG